ncbi:MAG: FkbM family methyltransferase, partial [Pseudomonadota bacterium]
AFIVNRHDYRMVDANRGYGVGYQLLNTSSFDHEEVSFVTALLSLRRKYFGDGVVGLDCGANIGVHTIEWAKHMHQWGNVVAFEAQEKIYYALAGNIAINNCLNASAHFAAVGSENKEIKIPVPDYLVPASFGSLELKQNKTNEFIGQTIDYSDAAMTIVQQRSIDFFNFKRVDLIKIDVEGMELDVLQGAVETIKRCKPMMTIEVIKTDKLQVDAFLMLHGYQTYPMGINILAIHHFDPGITHITTNATGINLSI